MYLSLIPYFAAAYIIWTAVIGKWRELHWSAKAILLTFAGGYLVDLFLGLIFSLLLADVDLHHLTLSEVCKRHYFDSPVAKFIWDEYIIKFDPQHLGGTPIK
jgi:hypothetical protein